jgi:hypothetical protein
VKTAKIRGRRRLRAEDSGKRRLRKLGSGWRLPSGESLAEFVLRAGVEPPPAWALAPQARN